MHQNRFLTYYGDDLVFVREYVQNFNLFWEHREQILSNPKLYYTPVPFNMLTVQQTLGTVAEAWEEHPDLFLYKCPNCGGLSPIYEFADADSAEKCLITAYCPQCQITLNNYTDDNYSERYDAISNIYFRRLEEELSADPKITPFSLAEAVNSLKKLEQE